MEMGNAKQIATALVACAAAEVTPNGRRVSSILSAEKKIQRSECMRRSPCSIFEKNGGESAYRAPVAAAGDLREKCIYRFNGQEVLGARLIAVQEGQKTIRECKQVASIS